MYVCDTIWVPGKKHTTLYCFLHVYMFKWIKIFTITKSSQDRKSYASILVHYIIYDTLECIQNKNKSKTKDIFMRFIWCYFFNNNNHGWNVQHMTFTHGRKSASGFYSLGWGGGGQYCTMNGPPPPPPPMNRNSCIHVCPCIHIRTLTYIYLPWHYQDVNIQISTTWHYQDVNIQISTIMMALSKVYKFTFQKEQKPNAK